MSVGLQEHYIMSQTDSDYKSRGIMKMKVLGLEYYEMAEFWRQAPDNDCKEWGFEWMHERGQELKTMGRQWANLKSVHKFLNRTDDYYKQFQELNPQSQ